MNNTIFTIKEGLSESFRKTLYEIVTYLNSSFGISKTTLSREILDMSESSLRSLITTVRKKGIKYNTFRQCYILYMLKEGNSPENYLDLFEGEYAARTIDEINITDYQNKLESYSPVNKTSSFIAEDNTPTSEIISDTSDETNVPEINEGRESIIDNFMDFFKSLPIQCYELNVQKKKYGEYFIINYVYDTKKEPETIVVIALNQEINNTEKRKTSSIRKKELEIIEETLDTADIFWFLHYKKTTQKQFDNYIQAVPKLIYKTLIEAINDYNKIRIIYGGPKTKLCYIKSEYLTHIKYNYNFDGIFKFTITNSFK